MLADIRRELIDGRGMVMMQNFPVERLDREGIAIAYMGLGAYLGEKMMQNKYGHVLGHVKDIGENYGTTGRSYNTNAEVRFHSDACDYVGLLCLHPAKHGGTSRVASSVTLYNKMLERRPDLVEVLTKDFYRSHNGEMTPGTSPWYKQPIFCFTDGYFSAIGAGSTIEKVLAASRRAAADAGAAGSHRGLSRASSTNSPPTSSSRKATSSSSPITSRCTAGADSRTGRSRTGGGTCCGSGCAIPPGGRSRRSSAAPGATRACRSRGCR